MVVATFLVFLGNYISNDFFFYDQKGATAANIKEEEESQMHVQDSSQIQLNMPREEEPKGD